MKKIIPLTALLAGVFAGPAMADFTGLTAPGNFTIANVGTIVGGSPVLGMASFAPSSLSMTGSNAISPAPASNATACVGGVYADLASPCRLQVTINEIGSFTFDWTYSTSDADGPPGDIFGVLIDGVPFALSDPGGATVQSGTNSYFANSSFGWFINCTDCIGGSATARISNFNFVPEPATYALLLAGLVAAGVSRRRGTSALAA